MDEIKYRDVKQAEKLKSAALAGDDLVVLGYEQGAGIATDLDGNQWPTQLHVHYNVLGDFTVVLPKGPKNKIVPYKLGGIIRPQDVRTQFLAEFGPKLEEEPAIASEASEIVNSEPVVEKSKRS